MAPIQIKKGLAINLAGKPSNELSDLGHSTTVHVYPAEYEGLKPRLEVKEGDTVKKGSVLFFSKRNPSLKFRAPAGGKIDAVILGARRSLQEIRIKTDEKAGTETFKQYSADSIKGLSRDEALAHLQETGYLALIHQRPFSKIADPEVTPKAIFINGMNTAPFLPDLNVVVKGDEKAFQAGIDVLSRLTNGKVHLCLSSEAPSQVLSDVLISPDNAVVHQFEGKAPAGNTSIHIHNIDPIVPGQQVWTITGSDTILIGKLFLNGELPSTKVISVGGPGVKESACKYYRIQQGGSLKSILDGQLEDGEQRVIGGSILSGDIIDPDGGIKTGHNSITVLPEGRERFFLGWLAPGVDKFSQSPLYLSKWLCFNKKWKLNTSRNGGTRAMVLTGLYDKYMPMNIMVDYLVRAVLAKDTDEAIKLGLLETAPEDFALCAFACPSKMDLPAVIKEGLEQVEQEGI